MIERVFDRFTTEYLKQDGAFLMRLIVHNTNQITVTEIICAMWDLWRDRLNQRAKGLGAESEEDDEDEDESHDLDDDDPSTPPSDATTDPAAEKAREAGEDAPLKVD